MTQLEQIIHPSQGCPERTIIWLHGLGADGNDFMPIVPMLNLQPSTEIIFPNAPVRPITINGGMGMRGWYDITDFALRGHDREGIADSAQAIQAIYNAKIAQGISPENIIFAGFSQGGAMALHCGTRNPCGGILALSCYLLNPQETPNAENTAPPIMMMHGTQDPIVTYTLGESSYTTLQERGYNITWKNYPIGHEVSLPEIQDISEWLKLRGF
ncbi:dienelactone hydrolase family protein [Cardiobacteriaceae bacterium TAE3-ERU3]|nr:dienelactone hydrolase family protein [Cardiobacteriaceae bacterium TAE3-ERU3]